MLESLELVSLNIWHTLISLCNLLLLFLIVKHFLYKPVQKLLAKRKADIDAQYASAEEAENKAMQDKEEWAQKLKTAHEQADEIYKDATVNAEKRGEKIVFEAKEHAANIIRTAETEAELEKKKAEDDIRKEIVTVSQQLAEKMLEREINADDHKELIDSFISDIGEDK